jgi:hypothetical protein
VQVKEQGYTTNFTKIEVLGAATIMLLELRDEVHRAAATISMRLTMKTIM